MVKTNNMHIFLNRTQTIRGAVLFEMCTNNTLSFDRHLLSSATFRQEYN